MVRRSPTKEAIQEALMIEETDLERGGPCVLLAEDDAAMRGILVDALRRDGYDVMEAGDGNHLMDYIDYLRGAIRNGRFFDVDLIVSDIRMPGATGLDVLAELRKYDQATPVVLITAFGDESTHQEGLRLGARAVLDKPFDIDEFRAFIRQIVPRGPWLMEDTRG